jgi:tRNA dimethylallyltransferase
VVHDAENPVSAVLIAGPTASGKSAVALALAEAVGGIVVNADSMQVYRDLRVLTARPTEAEEAQALHLLYGHVDGGVHYSVGRWREDAQGVLQKLIQGLQVQNQIQQRPIPIFVGGTGLYFAALTQGLSEVPAIPEAVRAHWRERGRAEPAAALHRELSARDPVMAGRLRPTDPQRIVRALEVIDGTGRSLAEFQDDNAPALMDSARAIRLVLDVPPEVLRRRIDVRFDGMMALGALDEARALMARRLDPSLPIMKAHGMPWLAAHLEGEISLDEAVMRAQGDTRRYAKRQRTWFRHRMANWSWVRPEEAVALAHRQISAGLAATQK